MGKPSSQAKEILLADAELLEDLMEQPAADLGVAVDGDGGCPTVGVAPAGVTTLLTAPLEAQLACHSLELTRFGGHG
jgi:hypothetical protein